ncbi:MAG: biotin transporter BioY [Lachnospiraceae bacterium]|nr:biotin transporter BioY [Lachnospiraceae bacterium]
MLRLTQIALMTALLCVLCPVSVPVGPVPVSLGVFVLYLVSFVLPPSQAVTACLVYLLLGCAGLPVFAGYAAGLTRVLGPTGGYLAGYLPLVLICAIGVRSSFKHPRIPRVLIQSAAMLLGLLLLYVLGTAWFVVSTEGMTVSAALSVCVFPFLPFDLLKIAAAIVAGNALHTALLRTGILQNVQL